MPKLLRITTVPISLKLLITGQMRFMKKHGFNVIMCSAHGTEIDEVVKYEECQHRLIPFTRRITPLWDLYCLIKLCVLIRKENPDIIHSHTPKAGLLAMIAGKFCKVKLNIHTVAGLPLITTHGLKKRILTIAEKITYWAADYVLANSKSLCNYILQEKLTRNDKLKIIGQGSSNGINLAKFSNDNISGDDRKKIKDEINYNPNFFYIIAIGRMVKDKGITELIQSFVSLNHKYKYLRLILLGPFENERNSESISKSIINVIHQNANIFHKRWTDQVNVYLDVSNLLIHASHREGFSNVLLQAGAMNVPILCSDIHGNIDLVTNKQTGLLFSVNNELSLSEKLVWALEHEQEMKLFANNMRRLVHRSYNQNFLQSKILEFYESRLSAMG